MTTGSITEIVNTVNLYPIAVDTLHWDLLDQVFTPDVAADFGGGAKWSDLASLKRDFAVVHAPFDATQHVTTNHQVLVDGDLASCISYVHGRFIRQVPTGGNMFESGGWYEDRLVRTASGWRIKERTCRSIWCSGNPVVLQTMPGVTGEMQLQSLKAEAGAGRLRHLAALAGP
jgi:hypothetical protein